jgi:phenylalanyl-tRNA synthetase beta chain
MTISYNWLSEYLPVTIEPEKLSHILTSIGLEVESMEPYAAVKGNLQGLVIGEVLSCQQHPNADKLKITTVNIKASAPIQIICGASNVAAGQKVVVATVGTTIYPTNGEPLTMKMAKIRGEESYGMICAEDEIGLGESHAGIMVLPDHVQPGTLATEYFKPYSDIIFEIGLTPNRMDAMSHLGVARDVCAYLTHHNKKTIKVKQPDTGAFKTGETQLPIAVEIENKQACERYSGVNISGVTISNSPKWLQQKLKAIGLRPINNVVDITNFILHESGQPLHAFDAAFIKGNKVVVKNLPQNTPFVTLDEKQRKLSSDDLMICNADEGMCIAGVFGGLHSGVTNTTKNIFLESAWFNPSAIRKTSFRHGLRTDAATRFEKGVDISNTVNVLKRAALMIKDIAGGIITSDIVDVYPNPKQQTQVILPYPYLKKLSGKHYETAEVKNILTALGFEIVKESAEEILVHVPYSKPDITLPADIVEEILRIDGLDNVSIPKAITITPSVEDNREEQLREKIAGTLAGAGFNEILTNSITNSAYFNEALLAGSVKMINNLSVELDVLRPAMLPTGLEAVAYNINRKSNNLRLFEFGKTYATKGIGNYQELAHLCLYLTGEMQQTSWNQKSQKADVYYLKGIVDNILQQAAINNTSTAECTDEFTEGLLINFKNEWLVKIGGVNAKTLKQFDVKQPVLFADINWQLLTAASNAHRSLFTALPKQLPVQRDLAIVVSKNLQYEKVEAALKNIKLPKLQHMSLFDIFESEKLGASKKSMAISFTFLDEEKTLTDKEIDAMMAKIIVSFENELQAEVRK